MAIATVVHLKSKQHILLLIVQILTIEHENLLVYELIDLINLHHNCKELQYDPEKFGDYYI